MVELLTSAQLKARLKCLLPTDLTAHVDWCMGSVTMQTEPPVLAIPRASQNGLFPISAMHRFAITRPAHGRLREGKGRSRLLSLVRAEERHQP